MKYITRAALLSILGLALILAAPAITPNVFANVTTPSTIKNKKRKKHKKKRENKQVVLKGRRGKHSRKPA
jgi:hypothetical protein